MASLLFCGTPEPSRGGYSPWFAEANNRSA